MRKLRKQTKKKQHKYLNKVLRFFLSAFHFNSIYFESKRCNAFYTTICKVLKLSDVRRSYSQAQALYQETDESLVGRLNQNKN